MSVTLLAEGIGEVGRTVPGAPSGYMYPISWALANASVRLRAPSLTMADDR